MKRTKGLTPQLILEIEEITADLNRVEQENDLLKLELTSNENKFQDEVQHRQNIQSELKKYRQQAEVYQSETEVLRHTEGKLRDAYATIKALKDELEEEHDLSESIQKVCIYPTNQPFTHPRNCQTVSRNKRSCNAATKRK